MKKRIIATVLMCVLLSVLVGCGEKSEIVTLPYHNEDMKENTGGEGFEIKLLKTKEVKEYLGFLETFDYANYEIIGTSTCMYTGVYSNDDYYMVTYYKLEEPREAKKTGRVALYKTTDYDEYKSFMNNFNTKKYEILGTSTCMYTGAYSSDDYYMVTYIEILQ